jgi:hypothetical protein
VIVDGEDVFSRGLAEADTERKRPAEWRRTPVDFGQVAPWTDEDLREYPFEHLPNDPSFGALVTQ